VKNVAESCKFTKYLIKVVLDYILLNYLIKRENTTAMLCLKTIDVSILKEKVFYVFFLMY